MTDIEISTKSKPDMVQKLQKQKGEWSKCRTESVQHKDIMDSKLNFISYNTRGTSVNSNRVIQELIVKYGETNSIIGIQEHFLLRKNSKKIRNNNSNMATIIKPAIKARMTINSGRPKGGLALLVPKCLRSYITVVQTKSWRIQAITLVLNTTKYLIINAYLPCDSQRNSDECNELLETLADILWHLGADRWLQRGDE